MERVPVMVRDGKEMVQKVDDLGRDVWEFDSMGANRALELLGKNQKLWIEKHELTGKDGKDLLVKVVNYADAKQ